MFTLLIATKFWIEAISVFSILFGGFAIGCILGHLYKMYDK